MNTAHMIPLLALLAVAACPLEAQEAAVVPLQRERVYIGMVADERPGEAAGLLVCAVAPGSPAEKAGIRAGDVVLRVGSQAVSSRRDLRTLVAAGKAGDTLPVELLRGTQKCVLSVVLEPRPALAAGTSEASPALGEDRYMHPIALPDEIRREIRRHRRLLREQLASLPDGFEPSFVIEELNAIRNLARDAREGRREWMTGRAGEISVRFRDEEGSVVLYGANNLVSLELYDLRGKLLSHHNLNTREERLALPQAVLQRLRRFR